MFVKKEKSPTLGEALQKLRHMEELLIKKQEYLETKINKELKIAKTNAITNKQSAIHALKRKKRYEKQLQQIDGTLTTIELQREALEEANINTTVLTTMKNAAAALQSAHHEISVEQVNNLMDNIADQHDLANEIANAISCPVGFQEIDDDELEKELEALEEELLVEIPSQELPIVPKGEITKPKTSKHEDEEIKKLEKWASE